MSEHVCEIQESQFDQQVLQQEKPVIVDFWAPWCGPCKAMVPAFTALAETYGNRMVFAKCNVDQNQSLAQRYGIKSIPTLMVFRDGKLINTITGLVAQGVLEAAIKQALTGEAAKTPFIVT